MLPYLSYRPALPWLKISHAVVKRAVFLIAAMVSLSVKMDQSAHLRKCANKMIHILRRATFIFLLLISSVTAYSQELWQNTKFGMSVAEVMQLHKDAVIAESPGSYASGLKAKLILPVYKISGIDFKVDFAFKDDSLQMVRLYTKSEYPDKDFRKMETLLKKKYGQPIDYNGVSNSMHWMIDGTSITLTNIRDDIIIQYKIDDQVNKL